jgi:uncharacterized protein
MLIELKLTNYKSFKDEQTFSMVASADKKLREENSSPAESLPRTRLLHSAAVYGPNASGKSNLVHTLAFLHGFVTQSINRPLEAPIPIQPFLLDTATRQSPTHLEITFEQDKVRYQYGLFFTAERIHEEWLIAYPKNAPQTWFERHIDAETQADVYYFGPNLKGEKQKLATLTRPNVPFLTIAAQFNHQQLTTVYHWFTTQLHFVRPHHLDELLALISLDHNQNIAPALREFLIVADTGVVDFDIKRQTHGLPETLRRSLVEEQTYMVQQGLSLEHYDVTLSHQSPLNPTPVPLPWQDESVGTQRLFMVGISILLALAKGHTLVADELDSSLHPHLIRYLVKLFHSRDTNPHQAQLIFNTHDTSLLDEALFRRDQVWFTEKDGWGASHLYSLAEFEPRNTAAFGRGYMQGKYGAVPLFNDWREVTAYVQKETTSAYT